MPKECDHWSMSRRITSMAPLHVNSRS